MADSKYVQKLLDYEIKYHPYKETVYHWVMRKLAEMLNDDKKVLKLTYSFTYFKNHYGDSTKTGYQVIEEMHEMIVKSRTGLPWNLLHPSGLKCGVFGKLRLKVK
jgi:hypothetical protein